MDGVGPKCRPQVGESRGGRLGQEQRPGWGRGRGRGQAELAPGRLPLLSRPVCRHHCWDGEEALLAPGNQRR